MKHRPTSRTSSESCRDDQSTRTPRGVNFSLTIATLAIVEAIWAPQLHLRANTKNKTFLKAYLTNSNKLTIDATLKTPFQILSTRNLVPINRRKKKLRASKHLKMRNQKASKKTGKKLVILETLWKRIIQLKKSTMTFKIKSKHRRSIRGFNLEKCQN
jgi:hypothetical protein